VRGSPGITLLGLATMVGVASCSHSQPVGFDENTPSGRIRAILLAAESQDRSAIPDLVESLASDDPLVRLLAQRSLEDLTGESFGYSHADPPADRARAIERWTQWVRAGGAAAPSVGRATEGAP